MNHERLKHFLYVEYGWRLSVLQGSSGWSILTFHAFSLNNKRLPARPVSVDDAFSRHHLSFAKFVQDGINYDSRRQFNNPKAGMLFAVPDNYKVNYKYYTQKKDMYEQYSSDN